MVRCLILLVFLFVITGCIPFYYFGRATNFVSAPMLHLDSTGIRNSADLSVSMNGGSNPGELNYQTQLGSQSNFTMKYGSFGIQG